MNHKVCWPTLIHLPYPSLVTNTANAAVCPTFDQRGYARNGVCDKGATEYNGLAPAAILTKTYYFAGSQLVAMREITTTGTAGTLYYLHQDHLGSTSLTTNSSGALVSRQLFYAYGEVRWSTGTTPTTIGYTGQRRDMGLGSLMFYNARYYSPYLNRWLQPDVIVPDGEKASIIPLTVSYHELPLLAQLNAENAFALRHGHWPQLSAAEKREAKINRGPLNPQQLNRYSYVLNNPLKYTDPDGHDLDCLPDFSACEGVEVVNNSSETIYVRGERINSSTLEIEVVTLALGPGQSSHDIGILDVDMIIIPAWWGHDGRSNTKALDVRPYLTVPYVFSDLEYWQGITGQSGYRDLAPNIMLGAFDPLKEFKNARDGRLISNFRNSNFVERLLNRDKYRYYAVGASVTFGGSNRKR